VSSWRFWWSHRPIRERSQQSSWDSVSEPSVNQTQSLLVSWSSKQFVNSLCIGTSAIVVHHILFSVKSVRATAENLFVSQGARRVEMYARYREAWGLCGERS
jgi:hypothetical protein